MKLKDLGILPKEKEVPISIRCCTGENIGKYEAVRVEGFNHAIELCGEVEIEIDVEMTKIVMNSRFSDMNWSKMSYGEITKKLTQTIAKELPTILKKTL